VIKKYELKKPEMVRKARTFSGMRISDIPRKAGPFSGLSEEQVLAAEKPLTKIPEKKLHKILEFYGMHRFEDLKVTPEQFVIAAKTLGEWCEKRECWQFVNVFKKPCLNARYLGVNQGSFTLVKGKRLLNRCYGGVIRVEATEKDECCFARTVPAGRGNYAPACMLMSEPPNRWVVKKITDEGLKKTIDTIVSGCRVIRCAVCYLRAVSRDGGSQAYHCRCEISIPEYYGYGKNAERMGEDDQD